MIPVIPITEYKNGYYPASHQENSPGPIPIFQKIKPFNVSRGNKIGQIKTYHHNYEFSMEIKHLVHSQRAFILQGKLT